jgi:hypothetical protein
MNKIICTHRQIFLFIQDEWNSPFKKQAELLGNKFSAMKNFPFTISKNSMEKLRKLIAHMKTKCKDAERHLERFYDKSGDWLNLNVTIEVTTCFCPLDKCYLSHKIGN